MPTAIAILVPLAGLLLLVGLICVCRQRSRAKDEHLQRAYDNHDFRW